MHETSNSCVDTALIFHFRFTPPLAYESPPPKYSSEDLLKILLSPKDKERVCCTWPVSGIENTSSFIVDIQALKHPDDVKKDFFGKWMYSGSPTST